MISEMVGTRNASPASSATPDPGLGATGDPTQSGHSSRTIARRNAMRLRALELGVKKDAQAS